MTRYDEHIAWVGGTCSTYAITQADRTLLIDCGSLRPDDQQIAGVNSDRLLLTHFHRDQCGGAPDFAKGGVDVTIPFAERRFFEAADILRASYDTYDNYGKYDNYETYDNHDTQDNNNVQDNHNTQDKYDNHDNPDMSDDHDVLNGQLFDEESMIYDDADLDEWESSSWGSNSRLLADQVVSHIVDDIMSEAKALPRNGLGGVHMLRMEQTT